MHGGAQLAHALWPYNLPTAETGDCASTCSFRLRLEPKVECLSHDGFRSWAHLDERPARGRELTRRILPIDDTSERRLTALRLPKADCPDTAPDLPREIISQARLLGRTPTTELGREADWRVRAITWRKLPSVEATRFDSKAPTPSLFDRVPLEQAVEKWIDFLM